LPILSNWYNFFVPTPFYHLSIAQELLEHAGLPGNVRLALSEQRGAFLLGNTAPDVQVVSGQDRAATHFFTLPVPPNARQPWEQMLIDHPGLAEPDDYSPARAAFLAGYLIHLQADWLWVRDIFIQLLESESQMDEVVFSRIPRRCLIEYRLRLVEENVELLPSYLSRIGHYENHRSISAAQRRRVHQPD
jgi:hypothetical protein